jgi:DNA-directed RNA polymerase subunit K/omega
MNSSLAVAPERAPVSAADDSASEALAAKDAPPALGNFHLATVMFLRALQLKRGARPRVETNGHKFVHVAFLEVTAGTVTWETPIGPIVDIAGRS